MKEPGTGLGTGARAWYWSGMVPVPDFTGGSGTGAKFSSGQDLGHNIIYIINLGFTIQYKTKLAEQFYNTFYHS